MRPETKRRFIYTGLILLALAAITMSVYAIIATGQVGASWIPNRK